MNFTCFGEILWDVFPDQRRLGGAPLNVAYYLHQFGNNSQLISAVGQDELGTEALNIIRAAGIETDLIARVAGKETGQVLVTLDQSGSANYEFKADTAWDYISLPSGLQEIDRGGTLVFGSLATRSAHNLATLENLISCYQTRVFDLNLRPPFDNLAVIGQLLQRADIVKVNDDELAVMCRHLGIDAPDLAAQLAGVLERCNAHTICVTLGSDGAAMIHRGEYYSHPSFPTNVLDTVGAGDAFLAGLISELEQPQHALKVACAVGSLVASQAGAQSPVSRKALDELLKS